MSVKFKIQDDKCTQCNKCVEVCAPKCLTLVNSTVVIKEDKCMKCGHCFSICPTGAISLFDVSPEIEVLSSDPVLRAIQSRHSIRSYKAEPFTAEELTEMLQVMKYAPSAMNARKTRYAVINREKLVKMIALCGEALMETYPGMKAMFQRNADPIFRGAPHMLISIESGNASQDGIIAISEFELYAVSKGVATCNSGFFMSSANHVLVRENLEIKEGETITACLLFGKPDIQFVRPVARPPLAIEIQ
ncbi:Nitroreductase_Fd-NR2 [Hexamita inflata]|uniref:Nitroreductase Fd-NR2 n=1 Tax=Hexamita inflata TaxID=28002 RepID=A0AA86NGH2_9EUKA|nr:Nitroreductase Fd-NR2 [Hexamita inflata]